MYSARGGLVGVSEFLGDLWSLEQHCCLASLHMPYSLKELEDSLNDDERDWRELCEPFRTALFTCIDGSRS